MITRRNSRPRSGAGDRQWTSTRLLAGSQSRPWNGPRFNVVSGVVALMGATGGLLWFGMAQGEPSPTRQLDREQLSGLVIYHDDLGADWIEVPYIDQEFAENQQAIYDQVLGASACAVSHVKGAVFATRDHSLYVSSTAEEACLDEQRATESTQAVAGQILDAHHRQALALADRLGAEVVGFDGAVLDTALGEGLIALDISVTYRFHSGSDREYREEQHLLDLRIHSDYAAAAVSLEGWDRRVPEEVTRDVADVMRAKFADLERGL